MILGIAGTLGAGKGTVVEYLKSRGFVQYSSSQLLGEYVEQEGNPRTREFLGKMGTRLQQEYPGGIVEKVYRERYLGERPEHAIFEALHRQSEANFLKSVGGHILGVDADIETRYTRTSARQEGEKDRATLEQFKEDARIEDEGGGDKSRDNNIRAVIDAADAVILNNGTIEDLHMQIEEVLAKFT